MKKTGYIVILSGLGLLAYYYLNKKKPTASQAQLSQLQAELNKVSTSPQDEEGMKIAPNPYMNNPKLDDLFGLAQLNYDTMTPAETEKLKASIDAICPYCEGAGNIVSNQISLNLKGNDLANMKTGLENFKLNG